MLDILYTSPLSFLFTAVVLILSISIHEYSHALAADKLGDYTARNLGRLTINPKAHIDPIGGISMLLFGFGWGRPVPFNPFNLKNPRRDSAIIALAGPMSNLIIALILSLIIHVFSIGAVLNGFIYIAVFYNLLLAFFNLLPFGPLDGFKIVYGFLPNSLAVQWGEIEKYGLYILLFILVTGSTSKLITPLISFSLNILGLPRY